MNESLATLWENVAAAIPDQVAIREPERTLTYRQFDERAGRLAGSLQAAGIGPGSRVACYLFNSAEYLETVYAALKLSAPPVNVNYRYRRDELAALLTDAGVDAVVFHGSLGDRLEEVLPRLPRPCLAVQVADDGRPPIAGAVRFEDLVTGGRPPRARVRSGQDQILMYTGGTTGQPKGVVWPQSSLFHATAFSAYDAAGRTVPGSLPEVVHTAAELAAAGRRTVSLPVVPLMHTTGLFITIGTILVGGTVVFAPGRSLDPATVWSLVADAGVTQMVIAGNAVARPLLDELRRAEERGRPHDLRGLERIISSGVAWSDDVKQALLERHRMRLVEILGATEGGPFAHAVVDDVSDLPSRFMPAAGTRVLRGDGSDVTPGADEIGVLAFAGPMPAGYDRDPDRTSQTYRWIEGRRYVIPGDYVKVAADGSILLLGRGAAVVNTGGEKVYTKEVEDALLSHPDVVDCVVVGVPDERWGEAVAAVVQLRSGGRATPAEITDHVRARLADYKRPRHVVLVDVVRRGPNGKVELRWARSVAQGDDPPR